MKKEEWLEKAIKNELSEEELGIFEQMLSEDAYLREKYDFERQLQEGINQKERQKLKELFVQKEQEIKTIPLWISWAAVAAILIIGFSWFLRQGQEEENLYLSYYQKYPNVVSPITRGENSYDNAFTLYEKGVYNDALELFKVMPGDTAHFYKSLCLAELGRDKEAINTFENIEYHSGLDYYRLWYLSLLYLKNEDQKKALPILEVLSQTDFSLREKAEELFLRIK